MNFVAIIQLILAVAACACTAVALAINDWSSGSWPGNPNASERSWGLWQYCVTPYGGTESCSDPKVQVLYSGSCNAMLDFTRASACIACAFWFGLIIYTIWVMIAYQTSLLSWRLRVLGHVVSWLAMLFTLTTWMVWLIFVGSEDCGKPDFYLSPGIAWILEIVGWGMRIPPCAQIWTRVHVYKRKHKPPSGSM